MRKKTHATMKISFTRFLHKSVVETQHGVTHLSQSRPVTVRIRSNQASVIKVTMHKPGDMQS